MPSSNKLIEQAKAIVVDSSELLNSDMLSISDAEVKEKPRERRPGLGRKRARFSLKPNSRLRLFVIAQFIFIFIFLKNSTIEFNFASLIFIVSLLRV